MLAYERAQLRRASLGTMNLAINKSLIRANSASAALAIVERRVRDFNAINLGTA